MPQDITSGFRCFGSNIQILSFFMAKFIAKSQKFLLTGSRLNCKPPHVPPFSVTRWLNYLKYLAINKNEKLPKSKTFLNTVQSKIC